MQELDRKMKLLSDEKKHVADANDASVLMMRTPEQEAKDKIAAKEEEERKAAEAQAKKESDAEAAARVAAELEAAILKKAKEMHDASVEKYIAEAEAEALQQQILAQEEMHKEIKRQSEEKAKTMTKEQVDEYIENAEK